MTTLLCDTKYLLYRSISTNDKIKLDKAAIYYLFFNTIQSVANKFKVNNTIFMLDSKHSKRKEIYPDYKRKDKTKNPILEEQFKIINLEYEVMKIFLKELGFVYFNRWGYEADDLFKFYILTRAKENFIILSRDDDLLQLIENDRVIIYDPKHKLIKNEKWFKKTYRIEVYQWSYYKSLAGCKSDNVIGIPGIGEKYALDYLRNEATETIKKKIQDNWNIVDFNLKLVSLPFGGLGVNMDHIKLEDKQTNLNINKFIDLCTKLNFRSFLENLDKFKIFCQQG